MGQIEVKTIGCKVFPASSANEMKYVRGIRAKAASERKSIVRKDIFCADLKNDHSDLSNGNVDASEDVSFQHENQEIKRRRRVHFVDNNNSESSDLSLHTFHVPCVDEGDKEKLWWNDVAIAEIRLYSQRVIRESKSSMYKKSINFLMNSYKLKQNCRKTLLKSIRAVMKNDARGLESHIVSKLHAYRKLCPKIIIKYHNELKQHHSVCKDDVLLRHTSLKLTRKSRQLAFRLAQADQLEARKIHNEAKKA